MFANELNRRRFEDAMLAAGFAVHGLHIWIKQNATPNRWGMKNYEPVFRFRKGPARTSYTPGLKQATEAPNPVGRKHHPIEKPVELLRRYIEASSLPGDLVLDPFAGSGSTGAACLETGRNFLGAEIDPEYQEIALTRLSNSHKLPVTTPQEGSL